MRDKCIIALLMLSLLGNCHGCGRAPSDFEGKENASQGRRPEPRDVVLRDVVFSPDGSELLTIDSNDSVILWNVAAWTKTWTGRVEEAATARFFSDGKRVAFGTMSARVLIWDTEKHKTLWTLDGHRGIEGARNAIRNVLITADQKRLVTIEDSIHPEMQVIVWNVEGRNVEKIINFPGSTYTNCAGLNADNTKLLMLVQNYVGTPGRFLEELDLKAFKPYKSPAIRTHIPRLLPDGKHYLTFEFVNSECEIRLMSVPDSEFVATIGKQSNAQGLGVSPNGNLAISADDKKIMFWSINPPNPIREVNLQNELGFHFEFSPDGKMVAVCGCHRVPAGAQTRTPVIYLFDVASGKQVAEFNVEK